MIKRWLCSWPASFRHRKSSARTMRRKKLLSIVGAVLLAGAVPVFSRPLAAPQTTKKPTSNKTTHTRRRRRPPKPRGQTAPTPERIKEIQSALQREGAYSAEPTGKWDASTADAMKKFQTAHGLTPTGKVDALSLQKLGLGSETAGKGAPLPSASTTDHPSGAS